MPRRVAVCLTLVWAASPARAEPPPAPQSSASLFANPSGICHSVEHSGH